MTETAVNVNLDFEDVDLLRQALLEWGARTVAPEQALERIARFAMFVIRHPELVAVPATQEGA